MELAGIASAHSDPPTGAGTKEWTYDGQIHWSAPNDHIRHTTLDEAN
jgi:hypothetical protein